MSDTAGGSQGSITEANRNRAEFSRYGGLGAAGFISPYDKTQTGTFLSKPGDVSIVNPPTAGMPDFFIGVAWDNVAVEKETNPIKRFFKKKIEKAGVDIDLGCLYELQNGMRGGMQAFGEIHGSLDEAPWIFLSGDERRGDRAGPDEIIRINGAHWKDIERILLYVYIYDGARNWDSVRPQIQVRVPGEEPMIVSLHARKTNMSVCAVAQIENVRGGIKLTSLLEYYPGHAEMDRAFGYGIDWVSGQKD
jgi:tellurite resistance protein TerA